MASLKEEVRGNDGSAASTAKIDMKFELVVIPVSDPDRAKEFYGRLGIRYGDDDQFELHVDFRCAGGAAVVTTRASSFRLAVVFLLCA